MVGRATMLAAVAAEAMAGFLPWLRSGERERSAFEMIDAARTLDVLDSPVLRTLVLAWYLVPLAATLCWLAVLLDRPRAGAALAIGTGLLGVVTAIGIEQTRLPALAGARTTLVAGAAALVGGLLLLQQGGRRHELVPEP